MKIENISLSKRALFAAGTIALALAAGVAGAALVVDMMSDSFATISGTPVVATRSPVKPDATKVSAATRSAVTFYIKHTGTAALDKVPVPSDAVGAGLVLTADGWLATASSILLRKEPLIAVFSDKTSVVVDPAAAVPDPATGISYIKTSAQHLTVAVFGDDAALQSADSVFSVGHDSVVALSVLSPRQLPVLARTDYVESTERLARRIVMDRSGKAGSPVVDQNGEVVGIDMGDGTAVPETFIVGILRDLFKDGKIARPLVGIHFVSLDDLPIAKSAGLAESGAFITGAGKYRATEKGSAGEAAGLREGDVITSMERDRINNEETLSERLQDYVPGARVELTVVRAGEQIKVGLTLK